MEIVGADFLDEASLHQERRLFAGFGRHRVPELLCPLAYLSRLAGSIASRYPAAYHYRFMHKARLHLLKSHCFLSLALLAFTVALCLGPGIVAQESNEVLPLSQIRAGMQGYAYTIFAGDQVEKFDLEVIGVLDNFLGPKQPIAGVTPIQDVLNPPSQPATAQAATQQLGLPTEASTRTGLPSNSALEPIETPLVFSGFQPAALQQFANQLQGYGFVAAQGGTASPRPDDGRLVAGDMAGMVLVQGDASINSACTVTAVQADRVYLCGHPFLNLGDIQIPMARSRVVTTLSSDLASTKIVNVGGSIGTITGDHLTAVTGKLGAPPAMVPLDLTLVANEASSPKQKTLHFEIVNHPKLTPLLVAITTFSGLTQNSLYGEGTTLHLS